MTLTMGRLLSREDASSFPPRSLSDLGGKCHHHGLSWHIISMSCSVWRQTRKTVEASSFHWKIASDFFSSPSMVFVSGKLAYICESSVPYVH